MVSHRHVHVLTLTEHVECHVSQAKVVASGTHVSIQRGTRYIRRWLSLLRWYRVCVCVYAICLAMHAFVFRIVYIYMYEFSDACVLHTERFRTRVWVGSRHGLVQLSGDDKLYRYACMHVCVCMKQNLHPTYQAFLHTHGHKWFNATCMCIETHMSLYVRL